MLPIDRTGRFLLKLAVVYGLLLAPWPGLGTGYAVLYRSGANVLFGRLGSAGTAEFREKTGALPKFDSEVIIKSDTPSGKRTTRDVPFHTRRVGYLPTVETVALIVATSIPWKRKWKALLWGLVLVNAFVAVEIGLTLMYSLTDERLPAIAVSPSSSRFFARVYEMTVISPTLSFVAPILAWLVVCFRWEDWDRLSKTRRSTDRR